MAQEFNEQIYHMHAGFVMTATMSVLSILGAIGILFSFVKCPEERNTIRQLLLCSTLADCLVALSNLGGSAKIVTSAHDAPKTPNITMNYFAIKKSINKSTGICVTQSFISTTACLVSYFYDMFIALYFYTVAVVASERRIRGKIVWIHLISWVIPTFILMAALTCNALGENTKAGAGNTGPWCWITSDLPWTEQVMWNIITAQGWEVIAYILGPLVWCLMFYQVKKNRTHHSQSRFSWINVKIGNDNPIMWFREDDWNFRFVPLIFYLLRMWGTIRFILASIQLSRGDNDPLPTPDGLKSFLYFMQCIGDNSQGFVNFLLFCVVDTRIRERMVYYICGNAHGSDDQSADLDETSDILQRVTNHGNYNGITRRENNNNDCTLPTTNQMINSGNHIDVIPGRAESNRRERHDRRLGSPAKHTRTYNQDHLVKQHSTYDEQLYPALTHGYMGTIARKESFRSDYGEPVKPNKSDQSYHSRHSINDSSFFSSNSTFGETY